MSYMNHFNILVSLCAGGIHPRWGFTDLLPCTPVSWLGSAPIYRLHGGVTHSLHHFWGASSTVEDWSDPYSSHNRGYIRNLRYVSLYWITPIYCYTHTRLVCARGTWPVSGKVPAQDRGPQSTLMVDVSHQCGVVCSHQDMSSFQMWKERPQGHGVVV